MTNILLVDDDENIGSIITRYFSSVEDITTDYCSDPADAFGLLEKSDFDVVITDLQMPGFTGFDMLKRVKSTSPETEVIVITGFTSLENAVQALREGATDFIGKPLDLEQLDLAVRKAAQVKALKTENLESHQRLERDREAHDRLLGAKQFIGSSDEISEVNKLINIASDAADATVLLTGESGTGKELAANLIHEKSSRADKPFISVNCSGFTPTLIESELFGHEKGAFTGAETMKKGVVELAHGGTLFLDEIGDMPANLQSRLLRVLEERKIRRVGGQKLIPVDFRLITATNRDLPALMETGEFRKDLYFRLNLMEITLPPLRGRQEDIAALVNHYIDLISQNLRKESPGIKADTMEKLKTYEFPGNVRELRNMIERALILCQGTELKPSHFLLKNGISGRFRKISGTNLPSLNLEELENRAITEAMEQTGNNQTKAAELLGISRYALLRKLKKSPE